MTKRWQTALDDLKAEAAGKTDHESARKTRGLDDVLAGYGTMPTDDGRLSLRITPEKAATLPATQATHVVRGWFFIMSRYEERDGRIHWHLSASPFPQGRTPSTSDRRWLRTMATYLGAPEQPFIEPDGTRKMVENPDLLPANRPVHWNWIEESN
jgi:hypothetical protein